MRLPFFQRKPEGPIRIPLPQMLNHGFGVYFSPGSAPPPDPEAFKTVALAWIDMHAADPLRHAVRSFLEKGMVNIQVGHRDLLPTPPMRLLASLDPDEAELRRFREATHLAVVFTSDLVMHPRIGFWSAVATARAIAQSMGGVILDPEIPRIVSLASLEQPLPSHAGISTQEETIVPASVDRRGLLWVTTKGMCKFGLPEIEFRDAPADLQVPLGRLANGLSQHLLMRVARQAMDQKAAVKELELPEELRLSVQDLARDQGKPAEETPEGTQGWALLHLEYHPGKRGSSDFLRVCPPRGYRGTTAVWLHGLLTDLFGSHDSVTQVPSDDEAMEIAHRRAVLELPSIGQRFKAGLPPGQTLFVKHGFPDPNRPCEWMWIVVSGWKGDRITGTLSNDPQYRLDLRAGQPVELSEQEVYDWILAGPGELREGGYTTEVLMRREQGER